MAVFCCKTDCDAAYIYNYKLNNEFMPVSLIVFAGGIALTYIISRNCYREKLSKLQTAGFITGIASVVVMSL